MRGLYELLCGHYARATLRKSQCGGVLAMFMLYFPVMRGTSNNKHLGFDNHPKGSVMNSAIPSSYHSRAFEQLRSGSKG